MPESLSADCPDCDGRGWNVVPECCGRYVNGGCCEDPEPTQEPCERCHMSGYVVRGNRA